MSAKILDEILAKADLLDADEQRQAIAVLTEKSRKAALTQPKQKWSDAAGLLTHPACGKDAQHFISQQRQDADTSRESL